MAVPIQFSKTDSASPFQGALTLLRPTRFVKLFYLPCSLAFAACRGTRVASSGGAIYPGRPDGQDNWGKKIGEPPDGASGGVPCGTRDGELPSEGQASGIQTAGPTDFSSGSCSSVAAGSAKTVRRAAARRRRGKPASLEIAIVTCGSAYPSPGW